MSQTAIGKAALVLSVNGTGLRSGLAAETAGVHRWADQVGGGVGARMASAGRAAGAGLAGGLTAGAARLAGPLAAAAVGVVGVREGLQKIEEVAKAGAAAKAFGLTAEQFTGMAGVAASVGEGQREFIESLVTMGKVAAEGAAGKGEVAPAWFKSLNLDAQQFKALNLESQFFTVFEALQKVEDPAERVRALMVAFGEDGGKYLLPLLSKSSAEIRQMAGGFAVSSAEVEKATTANQAMTRATAVLERGWRGIAIAAAPAVEWVSNGLARMTPAFDWLGRAAAAAGEVIGPMVTEAGTLIQWAADGVAGWYAEVAGFSEGLPSVREVVLFTFRLMGSGVAVVWDTIKAGAGVVGWVAGRIVQGFGFVVQAFKEVVSLARELPDALRPEWLDNFIAGVDRFEGRVDAAGRAMVGWGGDTAGAFGSNLFAFNDWMDGIAAKQQETTAKAAANTAAAARTAVAAATAAVKLDNAALLKGSSAEVSVRLKNDFGGSNPAVQQLAEQRKATGLLGQIAGGVAGMADALARAPTLAGI